MDSESREYNPGNKETALLESLRNQGVNIEKDLLGVEGAHILGFNFEDGVVVTIRISLRDQNNADLTITHMTTKPDDATGQGFGTRALHQLIELSQQNGLVDIRSVQIRQGNEQFWVKNGFVAEEGSRSGDHIYKPQK